MGMLPAGLGLSLLMLSSTVLPPVANPEGIFCALYENTSFLVKTPMSKFGEPMEPGIIHCYSNSCCMAVWSIRDGELQPGALGCFPDGKVCESPICIPVFKESVYHCLCSSNMCNANITILHDQASRDHLAVYTAMATLFLVLCVAVFVKALRKLKVGCLAIRKQDVLELQEILTQDEDSPPTLPVDGLVLVQALREEHIAAHLWLGILRGKGVIIKSFPPHLKELYRNEWRILSLLAPLQHENIVRFLAAGSGTAGSLENHQFLVLQHCPQGSLRNYLTCHTSDWTTSCQTAVSLTRGLAFLHTYTCGDTQKPSIAHRDLNSDNILVTDRSTCIISDFGLSVILERHNMKSNNIQDPAKICMAGTLRYMSPEMLDGFLNLMSLERALTQADVYSLGLLLWEIFFRCNDLYEDHRAPEYQVVFLEELGPNPTLDELRSLVVENKRRPQLHKPWIRNVHSVALWETLEDCWDADSEARLTAQCAEQRLCNLSQTTLP